MQGERWHTLEADDVDVFNTVWGVGLLEGRRRRENACEVGLLTGLDMWEHVVAEGLR